MTKQLCNSQIRPVLNYYSHICMVVLLSSSHYLSHSNGQVWIRLCSQSAFIPPYCVGLNIVRSHIPFQDWGTSGKSTKARWLWQKEEDEGKEEKKQDHDGSPPWSAAAAAAGGQLSWADYRWRKVEFVCVSFQHESVCEFPCGWICCASTVCRIQSDGYTHVFINVEFVAAQVHRVQTPFKLFLKILKINTLKTFNAVAATCGCFLSCG